MQRHKRIYALAASAILMASVLLLMLCTAPAYARYNNTTTWDGVYGAKELVVQSNYLTNEGQNIHLPNWTMKATSSNSRRYYNIALFANMTGIQGTISCSSNSEHMKASLNRSVLTLPTSLNYDTAVLTLTPTESALTLEEPTLVTIRVEWEPAQNAEATEGEKAAEPEILWGEFLVWLSPEAVEETTEPTDPSEETTEPTEEGTTPEESSDPTEDPSESTAVTEIPDTEPEGTTPVTTEAPTEETTEATTEAPTEETTEATTEAPTEETTEATTEAPTEETTEVTTEAPTEDATIATTNATEASSEAQEGTSEGNAENSSLQTQAHTDIDAQATEVLYAAGEERAAAASPLVVNAPSAFSKEEVTLMQILPPSGTDQIVITYENTDFEGEFPFDTRYQVNDGTWNMLAEGGMIIIGEPASEIKLALDFSWVSYIENANITVRTFAEGEEISTASVSMSNSGTALSVDLSQVQPIIDGRTAISVPFTGEPENLEWTVELLSRRTDGTLAYAADTAEFGLAISIDGSTLKISNASGRAPAGTYRLILEQKRLDEVTSSVEFPLFIHY